MYVKVIMIHDLTESNLKSSHEHDITSLFRSIRVSCGTDNISRNIPGYFPHLVPQNIVMDVKVVDILIVNNYMYLLNKSCCCCCC